MHPAAHGGLAELDGVGLVENRVAERPVDELQLQEDHLVGVTCGGGEYPLRIVGAKETTTLRPASWV